MSTSCTDTTHPYYSAMKGLDSKNRIRFFREQGAERLQHVSFGEALDLVSIGGMNYCAWQMNMKGLLNFTNAWMEKHKDGLLEWNRLSKDFQVELPYINYSYCPRALASNTQHLGTIIDRSGKVRCAHTGSIWAKPSFVTEQKFVDSYSACNTSLFHAREPFDPRYEDDDGDLRVPEPEFSIFINERQTFPLEKLERIIDPCYSIISDKGSYLPLETVFDRISVGKESNRFVCFPFSGFTLANYAQAWYKQQGQKRIFRGKRERDFYRVLPDFEFFNSED